MFYRGQQFFKKYFFGFAASYIVGLLALFAVPSMIRVLSGTRKSSSPRTAYRRYWSTLGHLFTWVHSDLKPGTRYVSYINIIFWRSSWVKVHRNTDKRQYIIHDGVEYLIIICIIFVKNTDLNFDLCIKKNSMNTRAWIIKFIVYRNFPNWILDSLGYK